MENNKIAQSVVDEAILEDERKKINKMAIM